MSTIKVKRFRTGSVFKTVAIAMLIPSLLIIIIAAIGGSFNSLNAKEGLLISLLFWVCLPLLYGLVAMIFAASYNWLAPKVGGLEIEVVEVTSEEISKDNEKS